MHARWRLSLALSGLPSALWLFLGIVFLINLARFSEAFLLLDGQAHGLAPAFVPLILLTMNAVYAVGVYPVGRLSDRVGRIGLLAVGLVALAAAEFTLGLGAAAAWSFLGAGLWGLHMALSEGLLSALLADQAPASLRNGVRRLSPRDRAGPARLQPGGGCGLVGFRTAPGLALGRRARTCRPPRAFGLARATHAA